MRQLIMKEKRRQMRRWVDGWLQTPAKVRAPVRMAVESQVGTTAEVEMEVLATRESTTHLQVKCNPATARQRMIRDDVYMVGPDAHPDDLGEIFRPLPDAIRTKLTKFQN